MKIPRNFTTPYTVDSLIDYLQGSSLTLATCWKLINKDDVIIGATSHTRDLVLTAHPGITFLSTQGVIPSAVDNETGLESSGLEVDAVFKLDIISEEDIASGKWDSAYFEVFVLNYLVPTMGELVMFSGTIGDVKTYGTRFKAEGRPLTSKATQEIGTLYAPKCDVLMLGDSRCKVNLNANAGGDGGIITVTGSVTTGGSSQKFFDTSRTQPTGYFNYGVIEFTSGDLDGFKAEVKSYIQTGGEIELQIPMTRVIEAGTTYKLIRGCDRKHGTCKNIYNNLKNFRGFPYVPGIEKAYKTNSSN